MKGLGRRPARDERDQGFVLRPSVPARPPEALWRLWWIGDQGDLPYCVGYAWHALLRAAPLVQAKPGPARIYHQAQQRDEWPGEDYEGTSVRGGAKAVKAAGQLKSYGWAFDLETVLNWLGTNGPVVLGTNWYAGMFSPDQTGLIVPNGELVGGHAYLAIGYDDATGLLLCQNSWGPEWGLNGRFKIRYADADALVHEPDAEACTAVER
jgi:hypothetical protein